MDNVNEIKSRLRIEDIVSEYVVLKKAGRNFKGLCPFHQEKTPSFIVSPEKGLAYCFGCHKGGDVFQFLQEVEGLDFAQAIKILAKKAGVEIQDNSFREDSQNNSEKNDLFQVQELATAFYESKLFSNSAESEKALKYLNSRGLSESTIKEFRIGLASLSSADLYNFLKGKNYSLELLLKTGLILKNDRGECFDRFRNRIIFPINNQQGLPVAFTARILDTGEPKYMNSPETPIFYKSNVLFGLDFAKKQVKEKDFIIVVEGQMDVIMSHQAGVRNVVATSGTALTTQHLEMIHRLTKNIVFCFDSDSAGKIATARAIPLALKKGFYLEMINLESKDPADLILENVESWQSAINQKKYFVIALLEDLNKKNVLADVKTKQESLKNILEIISVLEYGVELSEIIKQLGLFFGISENNLMIELKKAKNEQRDYLYSEQDIEILKLKFNNIDFLRAFILAFPEVAKKFSKQIEDLNEFLEFFAPDFLKNYIYNSKKDNYNEELKDVLSKETKNNYNQGKIDSLIGFQMLISEYYEGMEEVQLENEFMSILKNIWSSYKKFRMEEISLEFNKAEKEGKNDNIKLLEQEVLKLTNYNLNG